MDTHSNQWEKIRRNYAEVVERVYQAATVAGRDPKEIRLVVVTKTQPVGIIQAVIDAGATNLGENYVEEAIPKIRALAGNPNISWHMIGHIQSRKAQDVCEYFQYVHSLDSLKLAQRLSRSAVNANKSIPVWMEFNVGGEISKSGWNIAGEENWRNILPDLELILPLPGLIFLGVMTVPPFSPDPVVTRLYYHRLKEFQSYIIDHYNISGFQELSMGMSSDFEVAIQEGSTCVRIGQAILGPRPG